LAKAGNKNIERHFSMNEILKLNASRWIRSLLAIK
jgi:hypothetical protein